MELRQVHRRRAAGVMGMTGCLRLPPLRRSPHSRLTLHRRCFGILPPTPAFPWIHCPLLLHLQPWPWRGSWCSPSPRAAGPPGCGSCARRLRPRSCLSHGPPRRGTRFTTCQRQEGFRHLPRIINDISTQGTRFPKGLMADQKKEGSLPTPSKVLPSLNLSSIYE